MEGILYLIGFYVAIWLIGAFFSLIGKLIENHRAKIRDQVLSDFQKEINVQSVIKEYKQKLAVLDYERKVGFLEKYFREQSVRPIAELGYFSEVCPSCKKGLLVARTGKYGNFIGCSNFPNCKHTENIEQHIDNVKNAKTEHKIAVKKQFFTAIQKAYH
ncbi:topoisomerase DNA-binding C4 zinc finger domain-containing protein [Patescibacteria group bacterium]|nr:topoisomerase DNA-binding C4 zinc finger domain-containing protein [Patescibacteria group bacterium]